MKKMCYLWNNIKEFFYIHSGLISILVYILLFVFALYMLIIPNPWKRKMNEKELYRNEKLVIVGTNEAAQDFSHDKFHKPIIVKVWLVQRLKDTTQFAELSSVRDGSYFSISNELWYSKGIGDTLYFDYIVKNRFFNIK